MKIKDIKTLNQKQLDSLTYLMDDKIQEEVRRELSPSPIKFLKRYIELDNVFGEQNRHRYIACEPSDGDHISDHVDCVVWYSWADAYVDRTDDKPDIRCVNDSGYLYVA